MTTDGINLPDGQVVKVIDDTGYNYLSTLEYDKMKEKKIKSVFGTESSSSEYERKLKFLLKSKLNEKNKILDINPCT